MVPWLITPALPAARWQQEVDQGLNNKSAPAVSTLSTRVLDDRGRKGGEEEPDGGGIGHFLWKVLFETTTWNKENNNTIARTKQQDVWSLSTGQSQGGMWFRRKSGCVAGSIPGSS